MRLLAAGFLALGLGACAPSARTPAPALATVIPETKVRALDSTETKVAAALRGRPGLVTLWATWCDACRDELPALTKVDAWAREHGAVVVGVAIGEPLEKVASFAATNHIPYQLLVDEDFRFADALGEKRVPATLIVDRTGKITYVGGAVDDRSLAALKQVL